MTLEIFLILNIDFLDENNGKMNKTGAREQREDGNESETTINTANYKQLIKYKPAPVCKPSESDSGATSFQSNYLL